MKFSPFFVVVISLLFLLDNQFILIIEYTEMHKRGKKEHPHNHLSI
jgi:hypothetical protein